MLVGIYEENGKESIPCFVDKEIVDNAAINHTLEISSEKLHDGSTRYTIRVPYLNGTFTHNI